MDFSTEGRKEKDKVVDEQRPPFDADARRLFTPLRREPSCGFLGSLAAPWRFAPRL
jgi:hypothetical protein